MTPSILAVIGLSGAELLLVLAVVTILGLLALALGAGLFAVIRSLNRRPAPSLPQAPPNSGADAGVAREGNRPGASFHGVNLTGADFRDVNLSNARFHNVNLSNVAVTAAQLGGASFKHIGPPPGKDGIQDRQRPVRFEEMMLCDSIFRKVDLSNVRLVDCNLVGMTIDGRLVTELLARYDQQPGPR